jgi:hypothetical protein
MDAEDTDNQGRGITAFFRTYWYIVVPVLVMALLLLVAGIVYLRCSSSGSAAPQAQLPMYQQAPVYQATPPPPQGVPAPGVASPAGPGMFPNQQGFGVTQSAPTMFPNYAGSSPAPAMFPNAGPSPAPAMFPNAGPSPAGYAPVFSPPAQAAPMPQAQPVVNFTRSLPINQFYTSG